MIKKMLEINPELGVLELSALIRRCVSRRGEDSFDYADVGVIDEARALELARATLSGKPWEQGVADLEPPRA